MTETAVNDTALITVDNITKVFPTPEGQHLVLDGVSIDVHDGEVLALLGKSGSGKSTLLRCIAGLSLPTTGEVEAAGKRVLGPNPSTAMVFQTFALLPWLTVQENIELGLEAQGVSAKERAKRALNAIDVIGLDGFEDAYPRELSGGMRQRVGFARALVTEPDVLLMDEPFSALDVLTAENLRSELTALITSDQFVIKSVVIVTHNIEEAVTLADRIVVLGSNPGRIKASFDVNIPRPRLRTSAQFQSYIDRVYGILTQSPSDEEAALAEPQESQDKHGLGKPLPLASTDGIAGFADIMHAEGDRSIARLADDLKLEVDDIFPLIEALELLQFANVTDGRVVLTEVGERYATAGVQPARELFRNAALENVRVIAMIVAALDRSPRHTVRGGYFLDLLGNHYGTKVSEAQLDAAIDWGRYADLFEYDDNRDELTLPKPEGS